MAKKRIDTLKRGDIFLVNFDPTIGSEIKKTRPAIVLQNDIANKYSSVTIVAAITSQDVSQKLYPTEVFLQSGNGGVANDSVVLLNQIRTIDKARLAKKLGKVQIKTMSEITKALEISLGIVEM